ncbi:hypothetical protein BJX65DRAFT_279981 [Aspergillus insuetus]
MDSVLLCWNYVQRLECRLSVRCLCRVAYMFGLKEVMYLVWLLISLTARFENLLCRGIGYLKAETRASKETIVELV